jgi:predicted nicotinamide N-methyase
MEDYLQNGWFFREESALIDQFILSNANWSYPPLVPEIRLRLANEALAIWEKTEAQLEQEGLAPPFWAFAWCGGQALARFILDNPSLFNGKRCLDLACGSGLIAIAASKVGSKHVLAADIDLFAVESARLNALGNEVSIDVVKHDFLAGPIPEIDILFIGDLFYEASLAQNVLVWAKSALKQGVMVFVGDPGRSYFPQKEFVSICSYEVPVSLEIEDTAQKPTTVWRLA